MPKNQKNKLRTVGLAAALVPCSGSSCSVCHFLNLLGNIVNWLLGIAFLVAIFFVVVSGYRYLRAAGEPEKLRWAKNGMKYSLAGFAICLLAWLGVHLIYTTSGYKGDWWRMECVFEASGSSQMSSQAELYKNEVPLRELGGRDNPINLGDVAATGVRNLPANRYFFLHGLGGQPLPGAAKQLVKIISEADSEGKIVYVVTPQVDPQTREITGSQAVNLSSRRGPATRQTERNIRETLAGLVADSPSGTNFPFFVADSVSDLSQFNNIWPSQIAQEKSLKTNHNGVVYAEGEELQADNEQTAFTVNLASNHAKDPKEEQFSLNLDNPITFSLPQDIAPAAAKQMAVDIAQTVAEATKNSRVMDKDQWNQLIGLMSKTVVGENKPTTLDDATDTVRNPAVFASYAVKNPGQTTDASRLAAAEKELNRLAKEVIDYETTGDLAPAAARVKTQDFTESIQDYILTAISNTPALDEWMAQEGVAAGEIDNFSDAINVNRVPNIDPSRLSKIGGHISTDNILSLKDREAIRQLVVDVQKEIKDNTGIDYNIPPDLVMCVFNKETKFDPGAMSQTGCSGLGQLNMGAANSSTKKLKNYAPRHFAAFAEKVQRVFGVGLEATMVREGGNEMKRIILRSDPNLNAALAYVHLTNKGVARRGLPAKNLGDLTSMVNGYGPGNSSYAFGILECFKSLSWRVIPEKIQAMINQREAI